MERALLRRGGAAVGSVGLLALGATSCGTPFQAVSTKPIYAYEDGCITVEVSGSGFEPDGFEVRFGETPATVTWPPEQVSWRVYEWTDDEGDHVEVVYADPETGFETVDPAFADQPFEEFTEANPEYGYRVSVDVPPHAPGIVPVTVVSGGVESTISTGFSYVVCAPGFDENGAALPGPRVDYALPLDADGNPTDWIDPASGGFVYVAGCGFDDSTTVAVNLPDGTVADAAPERYCTTEMVVPVSPFDGYGTAWLAIDTSEQAPNEDVAFDYNCAGPGFTGVAPTTAATDGSTVATVTGCGYFDDGVVHTTAYIDAAEPVADEAGVYGPIEGTALETLLLDPFTLEVVLPAHAAGPVDLLLVNPDPVDVSGATPLSFVSVPEAVSYYDPITVDTVVPAYGPEAGGIAVDLYGSGFTADVAVTWGGMPLDAVDFTVVDGTRITIPQNPAGTGAVSVEVSDPTSGFAGSATFYYAD